MFGDRAIAVASTRLSPLVRDARDIHLPMTLFSGSELYVGKAIGLR